ncbi:MAG: type II toxin-antitoxin system RelE/ParE family toxin [Methanoregula sp.]|jgi:mRNA-degrading endonuclease RelE of RelBE toxin-antitoxin system
MVWTIKRTDTFLETFARVRSNKQLIKELGKKIQRLGEDPETVGGWLTGSLHGKKSTRIAKRYRLIFRPDEREHIVYLIAIDHRRRVYK